MAKVSKMDVKYWPQTPKGGYMPRFRKQAILQGQKVYPTWVKQARNRLGQFTSGIRITRVKKPFISSHVLKHPTGVSTQTGFVIYWRDDITPAMMMWDIGIAMAVNFPTTYLEKAIPKYIQEIYHKGGEPPWKQSDKMGRVSRMKKGGKESVLVARGERTLKSSGRLETAVDNLDQHIRIHKSPVTVTPKGMDTKGQWIGMTGLETGFADANYVWFHEFGTKKMSARPFVFKGISKAWEDTLKAMSRGLVEAEKKSEAGAKAHPTDRVLVPPTVGGVPVATGGGKLVGGVTAGSALSAVDMRMGTYDPKERMTAYALMWWLLPPSQMWAVMGGASDVLAILSGELLSARYLMPWLQAFALGKLSTKIRVPLTKKYARRGFRRKAYRGKGKYKRNK